MDDASALHPLLQAVIATLLVIGGSFAAIGAIGLARLPDFYQRLHAPTKVSTLGVGGVLLASLLVQWADGQWGVRELLITLFLFVTTPVSAHLLAQAAMHRRVRSQVPPPADVDRG